MKRLLIFTASVCLLLAPQALHAQWSLTGNAGTNGSTNFIGTTDNVNFKIRTNNSIRMNITGSGKVAIGNFSPVFKLDVKGGSINTDSMYRIDGMQVLSKNNANQIELGSGSPKVGIGMSTPVFTLDVNGTIGATGGNSNNWNTAYSWGNHATAGYLTAGGLTAGVIPRWSGSQFVNGIIQDDGTNLGIGSAPANNVKLVVSGTDNVARFTGTSNMYVSFFEGSSYRGYIGSFAGNSADVDFGTGGGNLSGKLHLTIKASPKLTIDSTGRVGIGTQSPLAKLQISYASTINDPQIMLNQTNADFSRISFTNNTTSNYWTIAGVPVSTNSQSRLNFYNNVYGDVMSLTGNGDVCIGTYTPATGYRLSVQGKIITEELKVMLHGNWPDYVFDESYKLMPLDELKDHVDREKHLPGFPSAAEVTTADGFEIGAMQQMLVKKVEELTLYILHQQEEIDMLKNAVHTTETRTK
jgi:hypothetical protein